MKVIILAAFEVRYWDKNVSFYSLPVSTTCVLIKQKIPDSSPPTNFPLH